MEVVENLRHVTCAQQLPAVRYESESGAVGDAEGVLEFRGVSAAFIVREAEPEHLSRAVTSVRSGQARQRARLQRVTCAAARHDDTYPDAELSAGRAGLVHHDLQRGSDAADERGIARGVHLDLQPTRALGRVVCGRLAHDAPHVRLRAHARPRRVVESLKPEPPALADVGEHGRPGFGERTRQALSVGFCELEQRGKPHRPGEVQVQVRLGQIT